MLTELTIPKARSAEPALDQAKLYTVGLRHAQRLANRIWTDYNVHDPGVTVLELLTYALTDLTYRASYRVADLLAFDKDNAAEMQKLFFKARAILPNRPLTLLDYRKLLIDLQDVKNAWLRPSPQTLYADLNKGELTDKNPGPSAVEVQVRGLYDVLIEYNDGVTSGRKKAALAEVQQTLQANRNLCEDFASFSDVNTQKFQLCAELELAPDADVAKTQAQIFFEVNRYLAPDVMNYSLSEMLERRKSDGTKFSVDKIFDGPQLRCGFIDDEELAKADLRERIYLSDVISIIMDIPGVLAVKDIVINPEGTTGALANKWIVPVEPNSKAQLDLNKSRLVCYKRNMPIYIKDLWRPTYADLVKQARAKTETVREEDLEVPVGQFRQPSDYYSFQNHFPVVYGLSEAGLSSTATDDRKALAYQLKAYLLFFDQLMANYVAQLSHVRDLLSADPALKRTYFGQLVDTFADHDKIYGAGADQGWLDALVEDPADLAPVERRTKFLDHLIARFAERFTDYANIMLSAFPATTTRESLNADRCQFLQEYASLSSERGLAYNYTLRDAVSLWDSQNVSGLEKRLVRLLGLRDFTRRNLSPDAASDGMYVIEMILLLPEQKADPFLPICPDPTCTDCGDPYSYRLHIILPAEQERGWFTKLDFRRYVESVIRAETPAHLLPRICWISRDDMRKLERAYRDWISLKAGADTTGRADKLKRFIEILFAVRNVYPPQPLHECDRGEKVQKFLVGQAALGTMKRSNPNPP